MARFRAYLRFRVQGVGTHEDWLSLNAECYTLSWGGGGGGRFPELGVLFSGGGGGGGGEGGGVLP